MEDLSRLASGAAERGWYGYWFHRRLLARRLRPVFQISYFRMARESETGSVPIRLTIDRGLRAQRREDVRFDNAATGIQLSENQPILELKFRHEMPALFTRLMEEFSLSPEPVSKYRLAAAALAITEPLELQPQ
jgi:hypothetical protein